MGNRLRDLAHLLLAYCQVVHFFSRVDLNMKILEKLLGILDHFLVIDPESLSWLAADEDVLCHCKVAHHI